MFDLSPVDLRFILASLASIWFCIEPPTAGLREIAIGSALAICRRMVTKKTDLRLGRMLQEFVKSGCALGFGKNVEPWGRVR